MEFGTPSFWIILMSIFFVIEIFTLFTFFMFLGFSSLVLFFLTKFLNIDVELQIYLFGIFTFISLTTTFLLYKNKKLFFKEKEEIENLNSRMNQYIGKTYHLANICYDKNTKIKIGDTIWKAVIKDDDDKNYRIGDKVKIIGYKSTTFIVEKS